MEKCLYKITEARSAHDTSKPEFCFSFYFIFASGIRNIQIVIKDQVYGLTGYKPLFQHPDSNEYSIHNKTRCVLGIQVV